MARTMIAALLLAAMPLSATLAQTPTAAPARTLQDALTDPALKGPEVVAFLGLKPGDRIADIVAGRFVRLFAQTVGSTGALYAVDPQEVVKVHPETLEMLRRLAMMPGCNVIVSSPPIDAPALPPKLDAVFIRQNYHDLHDKFMGPANVAGFNKAVFAALKPGGVYVVLDHAAAAGSGLAATETLHRIDPAAVKAEVLAAGFVFDGASDILANPADPKDKNVFDPSIRGRTDQFLLRFRKPK